MAGITKWFWVTIEGYLSYLLPKFEDLVPASLGSRAILTHWKCVTVTADYCNVNFIINRLKRFSVKGDDAKLRQLTMKMYEWLMQRAPRSFEEVNSFNSYLIVSIVIN